MRRSALCIALVCAASLCRSAAAHEVRPGYLELRQVGVDRYDVLWKVPALDDRRLGIYVELPADAVRLSAPRGQFSDDAYVERWSVVRAGGLGGKTVRIAGLEGTQIDVLARIEHANGAVQTARVLPDQPSFVIEAVPSILSVSSTYLVLGVEHILFGVDHLLFVLALVLLVRSAGRLAATITAFTIAHSVTLVLATLGVMNVPGPPVEACIALSIVFVSAEILRSREGIASLTERAPWLVAFAFGLLHGLGFAGALGELGLPRHAIASALLFFNVGVEIGQLAFVAAALGVLAALRRVPVPYPTWTWRLAPYAIGSIAVFWLIERIGAFAT